MKNGAKWFDKKFIPYPHYMVFDSEAILKVINEVRTTDLTYKSRHIPADGYKKRGCVTMHDWLREYNIADVEPFIEALDKTRRQYYPDGIDILKDAVSIPGISMTYVLTLVAPGFFGMKPRGGGGAPPPPA